MWHAFENGQSIGTQGSEGGVIVLDEAHDQGARITLERGGSSAPWSVTCGIHGTFVHTAFASSEDEGRSKYADMKRDLVGIMEEGASNVCYERMRLFADLY